MKWSQTLIPTLRQTPSDAVVPSHQLMLRAGMVQQVAAGSYAYLPLGLRVLQKVSQIVREEINRANAIEVFLPTLQPIEWWEQTGRRETFGNNLFVVQDRHGRQQALGPTHEEVMTKLFDAYISSYKQLPITLYQIQTKFRDEFRPRFGVLRSREFQMKDAYSFDITPEGLDKSYQAMFDAYCRIFERAGVPYVTVDADSGAIGGSGSCEFMIPCPTGEDFILSSDKDNYAANVEKCEIGQRTSDINADPMGDLESIPTPDAHTIDDLCAGWKKFAGGKLKAKNTLKTLVCKNNDQWVMAVVRGDHELNEAKLRTLAGQNTTLADDAEARNANFTIGFVGPHTITQHDNLTIYVDPDAAQGGFWVTGANEKDAHAKCFNWQRDVLTPLGDNASKRVIVADIRNAVQDDPSPKNDGGILAMSKGIEVGHVFKLGTKYSEAMNVTVQDENNQPVTPIMGCYGIGINRILAGAIESPAGNDDNGIIWPMSIAPYHVIITPIQYKDDMKSTADDIYQQLTNAGIEVILDDRDEKPGVKFKDADLIGIPIRLVIGDKNLVNGQVELKQRNADKPQLINLDQVLTAVNNLVNPS